MKFAPPPLPPPKKKFFPLLIVVLFWFKEWFATIHSLAHVFSCEFCEVSKSTFFTQHLRWMLSNSWMKRLLDFLLVIH